MNEQAVSYKASIRDKKIAVIGMGVSNTPLIQFLCEAGAHVTVFDKASEQALKDKIDSLSQYNISYSLGKGYLNTLKDFDIIFKTPGIRNDIKELNSAREHGAVVTSEMELFLDLCPAKIIAITGSDGKTTTTTITCKILQEAGYTCWLGGNIGTPLIHQIDAIQPDHLVVLELSSFQLMSLKKSPTIAVITNLSPNHLDYHTDMDEYINAKKNIFQFQSSEDLLVLNADNEITEGFINEAQGKVALFSRRQAIDFGAFLKDDWLCYRENDHIEEIVSIYDIQLRGMHNVENYLAAIAAIRHLVPKEAIQKVATTLNGIEHRIELVRELNGIKYYNDSIASSPTRTIASLNAFDQKVILIAGGYDKNLSYESFGEIVIKKVKHLILIGQTASMIEMSLMRSIKGKDAYNNIRITNCTTLEQAVFAAFFSAKTGDIVLLSPASASFDMFKDFEERGKKFKSLVMGLE